MISSENLTRIPSIMLLEITPVVYPGFLLETPSKISLEIAIGISLERSQIIYPGTPL